MATAPNPREEAHEQVPLGAQRARGIAAARRTARADPTSRPTPSHDDHDADRCHLGLDRIDQRDLPLNGTDTYTPTGAGVEAYIIDTGMRFTHSEFGGRATSGVDEIDGGTSDD